MENINYLKIYFVCLVLVNSLWWTERLFYKMNAVNKWVYISAFFLVFIVLSELNEIREPSSESVPPGNPEYTYHLDLFYCAL